MNSDTLFLEGNNSFEVKEEISSDSPVKYCLNCGTEVNDKFCPHCGQSTATPSKLKMKNFGKSLIMSFGRLTPGFLNTAKGLMFQPWNVIRDHIHGRHIPYSPPITMIIQIFLYATLLYAGIDAIFGTELNSEESLFGYKGENAIIRMIDQSVVLATLFLGIPICFGVYIAYYRHGAKKYNFAEYLAAFVYLFAAINLWDIGFSILSIIPGIDFEIENLTLLVALSFSIVVLLKAFPQKNWWKSLALLLWCGCVLIFFIICIGLAMYFPRLLEHLT